MHMGLVNKIWLREYRTKSFLFLCTERQITLMGTQLPPTRSPRTRFTYTLARIDVWELSIIYRESLSFVSGSGSGSLAPCCETPGFGFGSNSSTGRHHYRTDRQQEPKAHEMG
jgi:hypothetical protein